MKDLLNHQRKVLTWESWISHRLATNGSTYGPMWTQVSRRVDAGEVLQKLRDSFFEAHPPPNAPLPEVATRLGIDLDRL